MASGCLSVCGLPNTGRVSEAVFKEEAKITAALVRSLLIVVSPHRKEMRSVEMDRKRTGSAQNRIEGPLFRFIFAVFFETPWAH